MILKEIKYLEFTGTPNNPLKNSQLTINSRRGIIIKIKTSLNQTAFGEASPLAGFSTEKYEEVLDSVKKLQRQLNKNAGLSIEDILSKVQQFPSLVFAIESAVHKIELISSNIYKQTFSIPVNEVVGIKTLNETLSDILTAKKLGINTLKLKIGRSNFDDDFSIIKNINDRYPDIKLRLDVNSLWDFDEALNNIERLIMFNIDYIEQPVRNLDTLFKLAAVSPLQIAPDESLKNFDDAVNAIENPNINFIVIKPSLYGFNNVVKLIQLANDKNVSIIISSLFESIVGKLSNIYLASFCGHKEAHGLSPEVISNEIGSMRQMNIENGLLVIDDYKNFNQFEFKKEFV